MDKNSKQEQGVYLTPDQLQQLLAGAIAEARKMSPLEERKYQEEVDKEDRRKRFKATIRAEVAAANARQATCSHSRYQNGHKMAGLACPAGQGEWTTGGQVHNRNVLGLVCLRCAASWIFEGTPAEIEYAENAGLMGMAPPSPERVAAYKEKCEAEVKELQEAAAEEMAAMAG